MGLLWVSGDVAQGQLPVSATVEQIYSLRKLPEPLVPGEGNPSTVDNQSLLTAVAALEARTEPDDFSSLEQVSAPILRSFASFAEACPLRDH